MFHEVYERYFDFFYESVHLFVRHMALPVSDRAISHEVLTFFDDAEIIEPRVIRLGRILHYIKFCEMPEMRKDRLVRNRNTDNAIHCVGFVIDTFQKCDRSVLEVQ